MKSFHRPLQTFHQQHLSPYTSHHHTMNSVLESRGILGFEQGFLKKNEQNENLLTGRNRHGQKCKKVNVRNTFVLLLK